MDESHDHGSGEIVVPLALRPLVDCPSCLVMLDWRDENPVNSAAREING